MSQTQNIPLTLDAKTKRKLRQIAHHLHPVVTVGEEGVSEGVIAETERALSDHELIKVRVHGADRSKRAEALAQLTEATQAIEVQRIGKIAVLYKKNLKPNEKLSNLKRFA